MNILAPWRTQPRLKGKFDYKTQSDDTTALNAERPAPTETDPSLIIRRTASEFLLDVWDKRETELAAARDAVDDEEYAAAVRVCRNHLTEAPQGVLVSVGHVNDALIDQAYSRAYTNRDLLERSRTAAEVTYEACNAVALRDRIGQLPGWDQHAYDILTRPWRAVIGEIHPDDEPLR